LVGGGLLLTINPERGSPEAVKRLAACRVIPIAGILRGWLRANDFSELNNSITQDSEISVAGSDITIEAGITTGCTREH
jgi:hypothetical protein